MEVWLTVLSIVVSAMVPAIAYYVRKLDKLSDTVTSLNTLVRGSNGGHDGMLAEQRHHRKRLHDLANRMAIYEGKRISKELDALDDERKQG